MRSILEWLYAQFMETEVSGIVGADALYEKVRVDGHVVSMAVLAACGVNAEGQREVLALDTASIMACK